MNGLVIGFIFGYGSLCIQLKKQVGNESRGDTNPAIIKQEGKQVNPYCDYYDKMNQLPLNCIKGLIMKNNFECNNH